MTSATQIVGPGSAGVPGFGAAPVYGRSATVAGEREGARRAGELAGRDRADESRALPGRDAPPEPGRAPSVTNVVRLPGQERPSEGGPPRPLIGGGAFTLAVAIGLSLDQQATPDSLERSTPETLGEDAVAAESEETSEEGFDGLTEEEREQVQELQQRDAEVRRHEAAHAAAGGQYAGSPSYTYQTGPDGKRYAVGGEVSIDTAPIKGDPEATIRKAQQIRAAANAPADPSSQDRRVAAQADALRQQAQAELQAERREERQIEEAEGQSGPVEGAQPAPGIETTGPAPAGESAPENGDGTGLVGQAADGGGIASRETGSEGFGPPDLSGEEGEGRDDDDASSGSGGPAGRFAPSAFSGAAASYRGAVPTTNLVSIAV